MSARRWSFYTLEVGAIYTIWNAPKRHRTSVHRYGEESGKVFSVRRIERHRTNSALIVLRRA
jgi:hypothetical protein